MNKNTDNEIYDVVYADPPWQQSRGGKKECKAKIQWVGTAIPDNWA